ncbi:hypothetical protein MRB53_040155 [Persea americana]|nr:hypothetical protein MRB53_040155 [Persea americana]
MVVNDDFRRSLERLGLGEYYNGFVAEAFDSWEVLAQITEEDLNALNVRLGHRRILQRAIAERRPENSRPGSAVQQPTGWSNNSPNGVLPPRFDGMRQFSTDAARKKRKYTRHPKVRMSNFSPMPLTDNGSDRSECTTQTTNSIRLIFQS